MSEPLSTCALCPRLCRFACPVANGTSREAAVPGTIAGVLLAWSRGTVDNAIAREAALLCSDCGRCQHVCHLHHPLPDLIAEARASLAPVVVSGIGSVEGEGALVAIETDDRAWSAALASRLGEPVAKLRTPDALGGEARRAQGWEARRDSLRAQLKGRTAVVAHGAAARVLDEAGVTWRWLHDALGVPAAPSCVGGALTCCGGADALQTGHSADATRLASRWGVDGILADARCGAHLKAKGRVVVDVIDQLLERT